MDDITADNTSMASPEPENSGFDAGAFRVRAKQEAQERKRGLETMQLLAFQEEAMITLAIARIRFDDPNFTPPGEFERKYVRVEGAPLTASGMSGGSHMTVLSLDCIGLKDKKLTRIGDVLYVVDERSSRTISSSEFVLGAEVMTLADLGAMLPQTADK